MSRIDEIRARVEAQKPYLLRSVSVQRRVAEEDRAFLLDLVDRAEELARYVCIHGNAVYAPLAEEFLRDVGREDA